MLFRGPGRATLLLDSGLQRDGGINYGRGRSETCITAMEPSILCYSGRCALPRCGAVRPGPAGPVPEEVWRDPFPPDLLCCRQPLPSLQGDRDLDLLAHLNPSRRLRLLLTPTTRRDRRRARSAHGLLGAAAGEDLRCNGFTASQACAAAPRSDPERPRIPPPQNPDRSGFGPGLATRTPVVPSMSRATGRRPHHGRWPERRRPPRSPQTSAAAR